MNLYFCYTLIVKLIKSNSLNFLAVSILAVFITSGFYGILGPTSATNNHTLWELIIFSFVVGTLILTMSDKVLKKDQKEYFPRIGSAMIISAMLILIGNGIETFFLFIKLQSVSILGHFVLWGGLFFLSFTLASFFIEFVKTIIDLE